MEKKLIDFAKRPDETECFDYHRDYVGNVPDGSILETLKDQECAARSLIQSVAPEQFEVVHAPYGWTVRTVIEHCCDAERVFGYRLLRFAVGDTTDLPGWDENHYATCGYSENVSQQLLADEFSGLRKSNVALIQRLKPECWERQGSADGRSVSVRALAWLMAGHWLHHEKILRKRLAAK